jgi:hypothetical protein
VRRTTLSTLVRETALLTQAQEMIYGRQDKYTVSAGIINSPIYVGSGSKHFFIDITVVFIPLRFFGCFLYI